MTQRTLWDALDHDRKRPWRLAAQVGLMVVLLVAAVALAAAMEFRGRSIEMIVRVVVPLAALLAWPVMRLRREAQLWRLIGAVPLQPGIAPDTHKALYDVTLAAGLQPAPVGYLFASDSLNAFMTRRKGALCIAVSTAFSRLPKEEQRAGLAMLVGRCSVEMLAYASDHELSSKRDEKLPPAQDPLLFRSWLEAACAGDREGLRILKDVAPMIALLERLAAAETFVPQVGLSRGVAEDTCYGFLAWPHFVTAKKTEGGIPVRAASVLAELTSFERSGVEPADAELVRASRLRDVSGAEGWGAGRLGTGAGARPGTGRPSPPASARQVIAPVAGVVAVAAAAAVPAAGLETGLGQEEAVEAPPPQSAEPVPPVEKPEVAAVAREGAPLPVPRPRPERITVTCPACRAGNAPGNERCVVCGRDLSAAGAGASSGVSAGGTRSS